MILQCIVESWSTSLKHIIHAWWTLKIRKETFGELSLIFEKKTLFLILSFPETPLLSEKFGNKKAACRQSAECFASAKYVDTFNADKQEKDLSLRSF